MNPQNPQQSQNAHLAAPETAASQEHPVPDVASSTQTTLLISELRDGLVIMKDGSFRAVVACKSINFDLMSEAEKRFRGSYSREKIAKTLKIFMTRFFTQAFKRNCSPDGIKVFGFDLSPRGWWIPSDLGIVDI
jgi:hypothetical protein